MWYGKSLAIAASFAMLTSPSVNAQDKMDCSSMPDGFNRSIQDVELRQGRDGYPILDVTTHLNVRNTAREDLDLSYNLVVFVGDEEIVAVNRDALFRFSSNTVLAKGAITCAMTCDSDCGSIFGDGECTGGGGSCGCNYGFTSTVPLPALDEDDLVTVELRPMDGSRRDERDEMDNRVRAQFHGIDRSLSYLRNNAN